MMKHIINAYCMIYGILWCLAGWLEDKIDNSDFFAGVVFTIVFMELAYMGGLLQMMFK